MNAGSIVRCRNRDWVLLPSDDPEVHRLRPLTGGGDDVVSVHRQLANLIGYDLPEERLRPATFPPPTVDDVTDAAGAHLLWQAARLALREGAAPFRSLGGISIRPRVYQFVPLLMALRLDPVRLLIADDVGVGKTIEALLVARELFDRGDVRRLCVICPPNLCEQWRSEMTGKFNLEAEVIRSGTIGGLERRTPLSRSIYHHYPVQVASIDFVKTDRNRHAFLQDCPELVIVDEAHGAAEASEAGRQQRHRLVREIAARDGQHLILLTATPHSGIEAAFRSLLALLRPTFGAWDTSALTERQRGDLARHYVQRTRGDVERDWEGSQCFPKRESSDATYELSDRYRQLFRRACEFCEGIVAGGQALEKQRRRVRYWGALALLRCVMSSPAAAAATLAARRGRAIDDGVEQPSVVESSDDRADDDQPTASLATTMATLDAAGRAQLREIERDAESLRHSADDSKLHCCAEFVAGLIRDGHHPIVWCRFVATADYVADGLRAALAGALPDLHVASVTGRTGDEERRAKVAELARKPRRVLVATDCLSEGVNLQEAFTAVLHYDLPWNPNRLEQREGRVDRYGQPAPVVRAIRYFCPESPVDGVVLDVLLNKAREIHRVLGTHVPVPEERETVAEALLNALFLRPAPAAARESVQLAFDLGGAGDAVNTLHHRWDQDVERERINRTRFAQRAIKPDVVRRELEATDDVLGDPAAVRRFVLDLGQRLGFGITSEKTADVFCMPVGPESRLTMPAPIRFALPFSETNRWLISFTSPTPAGAEYVGRNHPFVAAAARFLMEQALERDEPAAASRCGVMRTRAVRTLRTLLLLRVRYLLEQPDRTPLLSEEVLVRGVVGNPAAAAPDWMPDGEALRLLAEAAPDANVPMAEKRELMQSALESWPALERALDATISARAGLLRDSHRRVRQAVGQRVRRLAVVPQLPPDLLGMLVLQPMA